MSQVQTHTPGTFSWFELTTPDQAAAKAFYADLFGWGIHDHPMGEGAVYTMLQIEGQDVAALYQMGPNEQAQGIPPHWLPYVAVEDVEASMEKARRLGGTVVVGPVDVLDAGRLAVVVDPTGATIALWQAKAHIGAQRVGEPGTVCWNELATRDVAAAEAFYTGLFGWQVRQQEMEGMGPYTIFSQGDRMVAGCFALTEEMGEFANTPPSWMTYFAVTDCDATAARAGTQGGTVVVPPTDIPNIGRFAVFQDPQGAAFSVLQPVPVSVEA